MCRNWFEAQSSFIARFGRERIKPMYEKRWFEVVNFCKQLLGAWNLSFEYWDCAKYTAGSDQDVFSCKYGTANDGATDRSFNPFISAARLQCQFSFVAAPVQMSATSSQARPAYRKDRQASRAPTARHAAHRVQKFRGCLPCASAPHARRALRK